VPRIGLVAAGIRGGASRAGARGDELIDPPAAPRPSRGPAAAEFGYIRSSTASAVALARELRVSDTLIRAIRHYRKWNGSSAEPNRNDVPRRAPIEALVLLGPRVVELCGWLGYDLDLAAQRVRIRRGVTKTDAGERVLPMLPRRAPRKRSWGEARTNFEAEPVLPANSERAAKKALRPAAAGDGSLEKSPFAGLFEAADGTRTHDLLHGKQTL
jgi:hypothetical protein